MSPPEDLLDDFRRWLEGWAEFALSQAQLYAASTTPVEPAGGADMVGSLPSSQESGPPADWLALARPGPPAHWLALVEAYGLEPPGTAAQPGDVPAGESTPPPLQDWLAEFQQGPADFASPPAPKAPVLNPAPPENDSAPAPARRAPHRRPAKIRAGPPSPGEEPLPRRQAARAGEQDGDQRVVQRAIDRVRPSPQLDWAASSELAQVSARPAQVTDEAGSALVRVSLNPPSRPPVLDPVPVPSPLPDLGESDHTNPAGFSQAVSNPRPMLRIGAPAGTRLPVSPKPVINPSGETRRDAQNRVASPLPDMGKSDKTNTARLFEEEAQRVLQPHPVPAGSQLPAPPDLHFPGSDHALPELKKTAAESQAESGPASILALIKRMQALLSTPVIHEQTAQSPPAESQPAAAHWPELPERLPPVQLPVNVLADPAHRARIDREQRGRSWTA